MSGSTLATILGGVLAAGSAATPVLNAVQGGSLHQGDYIGLGVAVLTAVFGYMAKLPRKGE